MIATIPHVSLATNRDRAEDESDPDQDDRDRVQDAQQKLEDLLHGDSYPQPGAPPFG